MNHKRRLKNLESQPAKHVDDTPKESALEFVRRYRDERRAKIAADPEAWERGREAREEARQERLRELGFPEGYNPTASEHLQRFIERRNN